MTEITFHFNVPNGLNYSCHLLRKVFSKDASVVVTADASTLADLDSCLWSLSPQEFVPHCGSDAVQSTLDMTSIVLSESPNLIERDGILINLGQQIPVAFEHFERLIEVVSVDQSSRLAARQRWKYYASRGYVLNQHDFATTSQSL